MKRFKEYLGLPTIRVGGLDSMHPMKSLGPTDRPPKGKGSRDSRAVGLTADLYSAPFKTWIWNNLRQRHAHDKIAEPIMKFILVLYFL